VDGRRLYSYARSGEAVPEIKRRSTVYDFSISDLDLGGPGERPRAFFEARVSPGTYICSLIEALGREFSLPSYTGFLLRVADGEFSLDDAATLAEAVSLPSVLLPADQPLSRFGVVNLPADDALAFHQGQRRHVAETPPDGLVRVYGPEKAFMGLGKMVSGVLQPECVL
jgi:tRNA U55 pseudouridine synthase TruB